MNLGLAREPEVFRWKFLEAPGGQERGPLFLLLLEGGEVAGTLGFTECPVFVQGRKLQSCAFNDWYILPRLRGKGMGDALMPHFTGRPAEVKLYFISSHPSIKASLRHGFTQLFGICEYTEYLAPLRSAVQGGWRKLTRRGVRRRPRMSRYLERLTHLDPAIRPVSAGELGSGVLNGFLERRQQQYPFALARDSAYLRWKYLEHPKDVGALFALQEGLGAVQAVFALAWRCTGARDVLLLADVYYDRKRPEDLARILRFHRQAALAAGANARSLYTGNRELAQAAQESGMTQVYERLNGIRNDGPVALDFAASGEWYTCGGDSDYVS